MEFDYFSRKKFSKLKLTLRFDGKIQLWEFDYFSKFLFNLFYSLHRVCLSRTHCAGAGSFRDRKARWILDSSRILIINKKDNIKKHHPFGTSIEIQKYPTCLLHRREPVCAKALKLNFFTNYYFFLLLLFAVLPLRIFPPPSLKLNPILYTYNFFMKEKNFWWRSCS